MVSKKVTDSVYLETYFGWKSQTSTFIVHNCDNISGPFMDNDLTRVMILRDNEDGPNYWCSRCGYVLDEGASMALRLYEVKF